MRVNRKVLAHVAWGSVCVFAATGVILPVVAQQASPRTSSGEAYLARVTASTSASDALPDSPGAVVAQAQAPQFPQGGQQSAQSQSSQSPTSQAVPQKPVGTAAAEAPSTAGVAASQPAGVAIAPAKQRRARTIIIRTGAIIGAAAAVGVVVGLTEATSSRPPGAH
jgi:hypothetical protein